VLDEVVIRKAGPVNEQRLAMLDRAETYEAGSGEFLEMTLAAFLAPVFRARVESPRFVRLMGRLYGEGLMLWLVKRYFQAMSERFQAALSKALPELSPTELRWRIHFMAGVMAHCMFGPPPGEQNSDTSNPEELVERMVGFLAAGFRAPAREGVRSEVE
jgi:hypothetical protein